MAPSYEELQRVIDDGSAGRPSFAVPSSNYGSRPSGRERQDHVPMLLLEPETNVGVES